jgi:hypothetical protein
MGSSRVTSISEPRVTCEIFIFANAAVFAGYPATQGKYKDYEKDGVRSLLRDIAYR